MSLDITIKPHYKDYVLNKNHKITHDEFEEMVSPDKGDFAYVIRPKHLDKTYDPETFEKNFKQFLESLYKKGDINDGSISILNQFY